MTPSAPAPLVTVLVPVYNEALKLMASLTAIYDYLGGMSDRYRFELLVVDDGSTDESGEIAEAFARTRPEVRIIRQPTNQRLGQALRDGFAASCGDVVVTFDSDLSYSVDHIGRMLDAMERDDVAIVVASPYMKGGSTAAVPWRREVMSKQANRLLSATSRYPIKTITGMVRAYDGQFIRGLSLKSIGPEINPEIIYKAQILRQRVAEIPARLDWSDQGERMANRKVPLRVRMTSMPLMFAGFLNRPRLFFFVPGLLLLAISVGSSVSLLVTVVDHAGEQPGGFGARWTQVFADAWELSPQTVVIAGFTFVLAVQLISIGMLAAQAKRYFDDLFFAASRERLPRRDERG
jgi:glycosyltransferase involved in cell wall biosynthesis